MFSLTSIKEGEKATHYLGLVHTPEEEDVLWKLAFVSHKKADALHRLFSSPEIKYLARKMFSDRGQ